MRFSASARGVSAGLAILCLLPSFIGACAAQPAEPQDGAKAELSAASSRPPTSNSSGRVPGDEGPAETPDAESLYRNGVDKLDPSGSRFDPEGACGEFLEAARIGPNSPVAAQALGAAAECHFLLGQVKLSALDDLRLVTLYGTTPPAPVARLRLARTAALLGEPALARSLLKPLIADESAAALERMPASQEGERRGAPRDRAGLDPAIRTRAGALDNLIALAARQTPDTPLDLGFDTEIPLPSAPKGIEGLAVGPDGRIRFLDAQSRGVISENGRPVAGPPAEGERPRGFTLDREGGVWYWDEKGITTPEGRRFQPKGPAAEGADGEPLRRIRGVSIGAYGEIDVLDGAGSRLLRYGAEFDLRGEVAAFDAKPASVARSADGTIYVLLPSRKQIAIVAPPRSWSSAVSTGSFRVTAIDLRGSDWELADPTAIALDDLGRLYVLDARSRSVAVFNSQGERVARVAPAKGDPGQLYSPEALAVDGSGRVYVLDHRQGRVLRYQ